MGKKICVWCGKEFEAEHPRKRRCPSCSELPHERKEYDRIRRLKKKRSTLRASLRCLSIDEVIKELMRYNEINGTSLTYGQFVMLCSQGGIQDARLSKKKE